MSEDDPTDDALSEGEFSSASKKTDATANSKTKKAKAIGSEKAIETMFKNAYRAELETIALAATKANIMISLNGFVISALIISGVFLFNSSLVFLGPALIFMLTAATSIIFALLAASPERKDLFLPLRGWLGDLWHRRARLGDFHNRVVKRPSAKPDETVNLLIYEDRAKLSQSEHWHRMQKLLKNRELVYESMSDHLYWLGNVADRKFRLLNLSYTAFRWGVVFTIISFISLKAFGQFSPNTNGRDTLKLQNLGIGSFDAIYEPSAVQQLPDGRILVVEDEAERAMNLLTLNPDGGFTENEIASSRLTRSFARPFSDLEGLSVDHEDRIYAITSHSLTRDGKRRAAREHLVRFKISANRAGDIRSFTNLRQSIDENQTLKEQIRAQSGHDISIDDLNIEGLAYVRHSNHLYIGLRAPIVGDSALILVIENPNAVFDEGAPPEFGDPILLNIQGGGIRALSYDPVINNFLIVNEIEGFEGNRYSQMWLWNGDGDVAPEPVALPEIINLNNVESIDSIVVNGEPRLLIMSDEGNAKKNETARYMLLGYDELR